MRKSKAYIKTLITKMEKSYKRVFCFKKMILVKNVCRNVHDYKGIDMI